MSRCWGQTASHTQQRRSSRPGQVLSGLSRVLAANPRQHVPQSRGLTGSNQAQAAPQGPARRPLHRCCAQAASVAAPLPNAMVRVRIGLAASTGRLDLSECDLTEVPLAACELTDLQELSLAGNRLTTLPDAIGNLSSLQRLQMAGNLLTSLPDSICRLTDLEGLWVHGNLLSALPSNLGQLTSLRTLQLVGNRLQALPESISALTQLTDLGVAGNQLTAAPAVLGSLGALKKLTLHGNQLREVSPALGRLQQLQELMLQGNQLRSIPPELFQLKALRELSLADNQLQELPPSIAGLQSLARLWVYGNCLRRLPADLLHMPALKGVWTESNPLEAAPLEDILRQRAQQQQDRPLQAFGLTCDQVAGIKDELLGPACPWLQVGSVHGSGVGYFKLQPGGSQTDAPVDQTGVQGQRLLVVAFGSAPGLPNFGGLLHRIRHELQDPAHHEWDTLYIVDSRRNWYEGGCDSGFASYSERLQAIAGRYQRVLMLGDSMGASAALMFSNVATCVQVFTPQVDLTTASIRPGKDADWLLRVQQRILGSIASSAAKVVVHSGTWQHDLDQARLLPEDRAELKVYSIHEHRLAAHLDRFARLLPIVRNAILTEMGFKAQVIRISNLL